LARIRKKTDEIKLSKKINNVKSDLAVFILVIYKKFFETVNKFLTLNNNNNNFTRHAEQT
jgi:hypothetical protein